MAYVVPGFLWILHTLRYIATKHLALKWLFLVTFNQPVITVAREERGQLD